MTAVTVRRAAAIDLDAVARLVFALFEELAAPGESGYDLAAIRRTAHLLLDPADRIWAWLAETDDEAVGVLTLNECASIYAGGRFGEISELYVVPRFRRDAVGQRLIDAAADFARQHGWTRLEVGAPQVPRWQRSVDFYRRCGFVEVGPRLKLELPS